MSAGIVHHSPDTPVSSGSPVEDSSKLNLPLESNNKNVVKIPESCSTPPTNGDCSGSSSPSPVSTPNLSFTPPVNGILTPPNDTEIGNDACKERGSGRLKFFKDGVLCLELSHRDEGDKRKWVQIKSKTIIPPVIHTTKEVIIPRHASPASTPHYHNSPLSATFSLQHRLESSASQTSDDGSSFLSSPRVKEEGWRKPVPVKGISECLEFFWKPAACVRRLRLNSSMYKSKFYRRPYKHCITSLVCLNSICSCDKSASGQKDLSETHKGTDELCKSEQSCVSPSASIVLRRSLKRPKPSIISVVKKLKVERKSKQDFTVSKFHSGVDFANGKSSELIATTKRRQHKDCGLKDHHPSLTAHRQNRHSPKSKSATTILNIPGYSVDPSKTHRTSQEKVLLSNRPVNNNSGNSGKHTPKKYDHLSHPSFLPTATGGNRYTGKETVSNVDLMRNSSIPSGRGSSDYLSSLPPDQQQIFQQQTVSKAISYTINSLLSSSNNQEPWSTSPSMVKTKHHDTSAERKEKRGGKSNMEVPLFTGKASREPGKNIIEFDQNSFLRHLLDTSDPIPQMGKSETLQPVIKKPSTGLPKSNAKDSRKSNQSQPVKVRDNVPQVDSSSERRNHPVPSFQHMPMPPPMGYFPGYLQLQQPFLGHGGFHLPFQAYESLLSSQNPSLGALAAAAEMQYPPLPFMPSNLLSMNASVAAAMASYFGSPSQMTCPLPSHPQVSSTPSPTTSSSTSSHNRSPSRHSDNNANRNRNDANSSRNDNKKSSHRHTMPSFVPNGLGTLSSSPTIPLPFHAPMGDTIHSHSKSRSSRSTPPRGPALIERPAPMRMDDADNDAPLNLSKRN